MANWSHRSSYKTICRVGALVEFVDAKKESEVPPHAGVVVEVRENAVLVEGVQWDSIAIVKGLPDAGPRSRWVKKPEKRLRVAQIEAQTFPIADLPMAALSAVMRAIPFGEAAAFQARTCKRFLRAFRDDVAWRARCQMELEDAEVKYAAAGSDCSWYDFYMQMCRFKVTIRETIVGGSLHHRQPLLFDVFLSPKTSLLDALHTINCEGGKWAPKHSFTSIVWNGRRYVQEDDVCVGDLPLCHGAVLLTIRSRRSELRGNGKRGDLQEFNALRAKGDVLMTTGFE